MYSETERELKESRGSFFFEVRTEGAGEEEVLHWLCKLEEDEGEKRDWVRSVLVWLLSGT